MTYYRATITKTLITNLEFGKEEIEEGDDAETAALEISHILSENDWEIEDLWIDVEEFDGELP